MSFPASLTTRTVKGRFVTFPGGKPVPGNVRVILDTYMQGPDDDTFIAPFDEIFVLDANGEFSCVLPATNDPQWSSAFYRLIISTQIATKKDGTGRRVPVYKTQPARLEVPHNGTGPLDLTDILNIGFPQPGQLYIVRSQVGVPGGIATLGDDGKITPAQLPVGQGGTVSWDQIDDKPDTFPADPPDWDDVTDKPLGFPPTAHSHQTSDIIGLNTSLASKATEEELTAGLATKASTMHVHAFADIVDKPATYPHDAITWEEITGKPDVDGTPPAWSDITDKPSTFAPSAHTHSEGDITGLSADLGAKANASDVVTGLAAKANTSHTHAQSDVTGLSSALSAKADTSTVTSALSTKADLVGGVIPTAQIPSISKIDYLGAVASQSAMLALVGQSGDWCIRTDIGQHWIITGADPTQLSSWTPIPLPSIPVQTVNGQTGTVVLGKSDVGLGNVDNTSDTNKPVSTAQQTALNAKAPLASPTFTGTVSGVTAAMVGLGNVNNTSDANKPVSTAQQNALDAKAPLASPTFTGSPAAPTPTAGDNTTKLATTAFVTTAVSGLGGGGGSGNVTGPSGGSSTDNAVARWDGTTGKLVQDSLLSVTDAGTMVLTPLAAQAYVRGQLQYDSDNESVTFHNNDSSISVKMGQDVLVRVWNSTGSSIAKGVPVYASGLDATSGFPTVGLASASGILAAACMGFTAESIPTATGGWVLVSGVISGLDTHTITGGNMVYLSTSAGVISASPATSPNFRVPVGFVLASSSTVGKILVRPSGPPTVGYGTANQILGMNTGASAQEYKTVNGTSNQITVTNAANAITLSIPSAAALPGAPTTTTATAGDNTTKIATTAFVTTAVAASAAGAASSVDGGLALFSGTTGKLLKATAVNVDTNADMTGLRRLTRTLGTDPGGNGIQEWDLNYAVSTTSTDLERVYVSTVLTSWRNEVGFLRGTPHSGYKDDALVRGVPRSDLTSQTGGFIELQNSARTQVLYKRDWLTGSLWRSDGTAAAIKMADVLVLSAAASVPTGTPSGTVIVRTAT